MKKKKYFKGKYYKFVTQEGHSFALIDADMADGKIYQLVFADKSYVVRDNDSIDVSKDKVCFKIDQGDLKLAGYIQLKTLNPLKKDVMGILRYLPIECKHNIFSMYGDIDGRIKYHNTLISLEDGFSYIEGDEGINFPKRYIWYNAIGKDFGVTMAIADIPIFGKTMLGSFLIIKRAGEEYIYSTLNGLKVCQINEDSIKLRKGKYLFILNAKKGGGKPLLAPVQGTMKTTIHEAVDTKSSFYFYKEMDEVFFKENINSSFERVGF